MEDKETLQIISEQKTIANLVGHDGWKIARQKFVDKMLDLQNAFNIEDTDPTKMLIDLQARKMATGILHDFLREIEGTAQQAFENKNIDKSYIIRD